MKISIRAPIRSTQERDVHPLKWAFEKGSELNFDGLELCMRANRNSFASFWSQELKDGAKELSSEYGIPIFSLSTDWAWSYAIFFPDLKDWAKGVAFIAEDARLAQELGAHTILMHFATSKGSWEDCRALLEDVAVIGEESEIVFGYEANIWKLLGFGGLESLCRMTDEVGSPHFGVYLHNAYPRSGLPLHEEVEKAGERLVPAMHSSSLVSDRVKIDFEKALEAMKEYFADGVYTFEIPWEVAGRNKRFIDKMLAQYW